MADIYRSFLPLDVELSSTPILNNNKNSTLVIYLRDVSTYSTFSLSILQILIEERRTPQREHYTEGKTLCTLKICDVVKAHIQVQSSADTGLVGKLSYRYRGPFIITQDLGNTSFEVQWYGKAESVKSK